MLLAPSLIVLLSLVLYPMGFALINSFRFWNLQTSPTPVSFIGFANYKMVFTITPFLAALKNTVLLSVLATFTQFCLGMGIALLLYTNLRGMSVVRALLIMPVSVAPIVVGFLFRYLFAPEGGLLIWLLKGAGFPVPPQGMLGNANTALLSIGMADTWEWTPFFAIVLYAALLNIPQEIIDAARSDGANRLSMLWYIFLPMVKPVAAFLIMIRFMQLFNSFDLVYVLTGGGPGTASRTLSFNLYQEGLVNYNIGLTAAMTWIIVIIVAVIINIYTMVVFRGQEW
ncbi:MAG: sugar ABC transporter permease [Ardenticatenia bacterium]|nr:sugar ABC transporter permease [Ardenticatenia bacterium]